MHRNEESNRKQPAREREDAEFSREMADGLEGLERTCEAEELAEE